MRDFRIGDSVEVEMRREIAERGVETGRLFIGQIDEDQAVEYPHAAAMQAVILLAKVGRHQPGREQRAVESVRPCMIAAGEPGHPAFGFGADQRAAVTADVVEGVDGRLVAANDDDRFGAYFEQEVVALAAHPIDVTGDDPLARDDVLEVAAKTSSSQ